MFSIGKLCSLCLKAHHEFKKHAYTVYNKTGKPVQLDNIGFIYCPFCNVQTPDAPSIERIARAKDSE